MSRVTCHVSPVTCHMSRVIYIFYFYFFLQSGETSQGRVCYQRGLPPLVYTVARLEGVDMGGRGFLALYMGGLVSTLQPQQSSRPKGSASVLFYVPSSRLRTSYTFW